MTARDEILAADREPELVRRFALALVATPMPRGTKSSEVIGGLVGNIVAAIKATAPPTEWRTAGEIVSGEILRQLSEVGW